MALEGKPKDPKDPSRRRFLMGVTALGVSIAVPSVEARPSLDNVEVAYEKLLLLQFDDDDIKDINDGKIPSAVFRFSDRRKAEKAVGVAATVGGVAGAAHFLTVPENQGKSGTDSSSAGLSAEQSNILGIASGGLAIAGLASLTGVEGRKRFEDEAQQSLENWIHGLIAKKEKVTRKTIKERIEELTQRQLRNNAQSNSEEK